MYNAHKKQNKPFYMNYAVLGMVANVMFIGFVQIKYNTQTTVFFLLASLLGIFFLESVNYLEHYGLRRKKLENGEY